MPSFAHLFVESRGKPIEYDGKLLEMIHEVPVLPHQELRVTIESASSPWRQGVFLLTDGIFLINAQTIKKQLVLWEDTAPRNVDLCMKSKSAKLIVKNVWDVGNGVMESWVHGAAMIAEIVSDTTIRFYCNDGEPDDDFDDLVFSITLKDPTN